MVGYSLGPCSIVLELLPGGDLYEYMHSSVVLSWGARVRLARDIALGLNFLHKYALLLAALLGTLTAGSTLQPPVLHRDLKSPNVLLGVERAKVTAKIADFGLAVSLITRTVIGRVVENPVWLAPEVMGTCHH